MPLPILPLLHPVLSSGNSDDVSVLTLLAVGFLVSFILSVPSELHFFYRRQLYLPFTRLPRAEFNLPSMHSLSI